MASCGGKNGILLHGSLHSQPTGYSETHGSSGDNMKGLKGQLLLDTFILTSRNIGEIFGVIMEIKILTRCQICKNICEHQV